MRKVATTGRVAVVASLAAILLVFGWPTWSAAQQAEDAAPGSQALSVTGTVEAADEDFLGRVKAVQIVSPEMGTFLVADDEKGRELIDHVGKDVTVTARRMVDDEGKSVLAVSDYRVHEG
jgi:hypothetical protein